MKIAVNDANILFDLIDLDLIHYLFQLEYSFYTTDLVINEIKKDEQKLVIKTYIENDSLLVTSITDINKIFIEKTENPNLSSADCSILITAREQNALILTGDNYLRNTAVNENIEVHGILWIFDELRENDLISSDTASNKLAELMTLNNRLPLNECTKRLDKWRNNK